MCNFCDCVKNLLGCNQTDDTTVVDDIETTVVCGNCQCGADAVCGCETCANTAPINTCGCGCSRCGRGCN